MCFCQPTSDLCLALGAVSTQCPAIGGLPYCVHLFCFNLISLAIYIFPRVSSSRCEVLPVVLRCSELDFSSLIFLLLYTVYTYAYTYAFNI